MTCNTCQGVGRREWQGPQPLEAAQGHRGHARLTGGWAALPDTGCGQLRFLAVAATWPSLCGCHPTLGPSHAKAKTKQPGSPRGSRWEHTGPGGGEGGRGQEGPWQACPPYGRGCVDVLGFTGAASRLPTAGREGVLEGYVLLLSYFFPTGVPWSPHLVLGGLVLVLPADLSPQVLPSRLEEPPHITATSQVTILRLREVKPPP